MKTSWPAQKILGQLKHKISSWERSGGNQISQVASIKLCQGLGSETVRLFERGRL